MKSTNGPRLARVLLLLALSGMAWVVQAQAYPVKPVRMIVPFAPGGNTDIIARIVAPEMAKALGQQIIIDNRGGAGSTLGTDAAAKSPPDGYTLLMVSAAHVINPAMVKKLPFDPVSSFAAISMVADVPTMIEAGVPGFVVSAGFGLFAPAGTPQPAIDRVLAALKSALSDAAVRRNLSEQGAEPVGSTPEAYAAFTRSEIDKWIKVARTAGIQPE